MEVKIDLEEEKDNKFMDKMVEQKCRLPKIYSLTISGLKTECGSLNQFLLHCASNSVWKLQINPDPSTESFPCHVLFSGLEAAVRGVTEQVILDELVMSGANFEAILRATAKAYQIDFNLCKIDSSEKMDLSGIDFK